VSQPVKVSVEDIKRLREETGAGVMDCKRALEQAGGDFEKAKEFLRACRAFESGEKVWQSSKRGRNCLLHSSR